MPPVGTSFMGMARETRRDSSLELLFVTQTYPRYEEDTTGPFIREIARGLVRRGHAVTVLVPRADKVRSEWTESGVVAKRFAYAPRPLEVIGYSRTLKRDESVRLKAAVATPLYLRGARRAVAQAIRKTRFDLVHAHWIVPNGLAAGAALGGSRNGPLLAHGLHGSDVFLAERRVLRGRVKRLLARSHLVTGCSPELVDRVWALGDGKGHRQVIPYGVDPQAFSPEGAGRTTWRQRLGIAADDVVLLGVGRMATKKGFGVLVEAVPALLERYPALHVVLAGGGDRESEYREALAGFQGRVHFPGLVERDELPGLYRAADLFTLPAVHDESGNVDGLPNVILESMASGLPVVASGISGIPLAVVDGTTGRLVPEQDPGALARALEELLASADLREEWGSAGRQRVLDELTWERVAARYEEAYRHALEASATRS